MKSYYRVMLGRNSINADECFKGSFIGANFGIRQDLSEELPERWQDFNKKFRSVWLKINPEKSKVAAGLACGSLYTVSKGINEGDIVICPDGHGAYWAGEVTGPYSYQPEEILPHRRTVHWYDKKIARELMSDALRNSTVRGTVVNITKHTDEIELFIKGQARPALIATDDTIEDPSAFALEKHLEEFLIENWKNTLLGKDYDIFEDDGELIGQQYQSDTGPMDILAISKDKKVLLVVELKKGRASDVVVGQILRYMGYVLDELAEQNQTVKGIIIALEDDLRIRRALKVTRNIEFFRYKVRFELTKGLA